MPEFLFLSFEQFSVYCFDLVMKLQPHFEGRKIDYLISVQRGGAVMSKILSDALKVPIGTVVVSSYQDLQQVKQPFISQEISIDIQGKNVVILDEICDSGDTLKLVVEYLQQSKPASLTTAVLVVKPKASFRPEFFAMETDKWVVFPGELRETAEALSQFEYLSPEVQVQFKTYAQQHGAPADLLENLGVKLKLTTS